MASRAKQASLNVWLNGIPVGRWTTRGNASTFTYFDDWLADELGRPLSLSLPFTPNKDPYAGEVVTNYFDNLLPDSDAIRRRLALRHNTGDTSPFHLLAALGRDCAGAAQLLPEDALPEDLFSIRTRPLDEHDVAELLRKTTIPGGFGRHDNDDADLRLSIAGAQEKTALLWQDGQWHLPVGSTPTTHLLKLPLGLVGNMQADMSTSVENEWLCSLIMESFGLPVARTAILRFEDQKVLAVERFDRKYADDGSWIVRLPQEDMCQATGCSPLRKYQGDGGPGIDAIMKLLLGSETAELDRRNFYKTQLVFWLLMAPDGHAKNFSIALLPKARYRATPLYDVLSAHPVVGTGRNKMSPNRVKLAMAIHGTENHYHVRHIQRRHWSAMADRVGLGARAAEAIIEEVLAQVPLVIDAVSRQLPRDFPEHLADQILQGIRDQAARLGGQTDR